MNQTLPTLWIGPTDQAEFRAAAAWLIGRGAWTAGNVPAALHLLTEKGLAPAVIVLAEFSPPRISKGQLEALHQAAPLARIVRLLGPWFEGEVRTGLPLPAALRIYWHQWPSHLPRLVTPVPADGDHGETVFNPWLISPATAADDERLLACDPLNSARSNSSTALIAVVSPQRETGQALCDVCSLRGWKTVWLRTPPVETPLKVDTIVFDSSACAQAELATVAALQAISGHAPLVVLQGFPRSEDIAQWHAAGAAAVVSKPFLAADLLGQIAQCVARPPQCEGAGV
ncbi:MAG TPA: hypothetical protein VFE46_00850 [Pirellulales bacterium]|jgi:CheY-like chemotaxis protein|nr:hypothetical protein [Pirellulales bacterium]